MSNENETFLVECDRCQARVAAKQSGMAERSGWDDEISEPYASQLCVGKCPHCNSLLAAMREQIGFANFDSEYDIWTDGLRVYPNPAKTFGVGIPKVVKASITEAQRCVNAGANTAACVMLGRTVEALCHDIIPAKHKAEVDAAKQAGTAAPAPLPKRLMLGAGIKALHDRKIIDDRLFSWSQQIQSFRNSAAHAVDVDITRQDANDLLTFVTALIEYVYDLTERYEEFVARALNGKQKPVV
ncbi:MAG: DUF4145 domain-containing protein [Comamonadaceae bacterium]|nr:MAG: DUF4145 domain-containing protein [Comamonadaceae bacterium]